MIGIIKKGWLGLSGRGLKRGFEFWGSLPPNMLMNPAAAAERKRGRAASSKVQIQQQPLAGETPKMSKMSRMSKMSKMSKMSEMSKMSKMSEMSKV